MCFSSNGDQEAILLYCFSAELAEIPKFFQFLLLRFIHINTSLIYKVPFKTDKFVTTNDIILVLIVMLREIKIRNLLEKGLNIP